MKKLVLWFLLFWPLSSLAQLTTVGGTVVDSDNTAWANGTWTSQFMPNPGQPNIGMYTINGVPISGAPYAQYIQQSGSLSGSGVFSFTVLDNSLVTPSGSMLQITMCPQATSKCGSITLPVSGPTVTIATATIKAAIPAPRFPGVIGNYGYADVEAQIQLVPGSIYYNVTNQCFRQYNSGTLSWTCLSTTNPIPNTPDVVYLPAGVNPAGTLQTALTGAGSNKTIVVPATYSETYTTVTNVVNSNVTILCALGANFISSGAAQGLNVSAQFFTMSGCTWSGATSQNIFVTAAFSNIHNNFFSGGGNTIPGSGTGAGVEYETNGANDAWNTDNVYTGEGSSTGANTGKGGDIVANHTTNQSNNGTNRLHILRNRIYGNNTPFNIKLFDVSDTDVIQNNVDGNNIVDDPAASGYGILSYNSSTATGANFRVNVSLNNVTNTGGSGIYMQGDLYYVVNGNVVTNTCQQQTDALLVVAGIAIAAGNTASPSSLGGVITSNTIHTSAKQGIEISHTTKILIQGNNISDIAKFGIWVTGANNADFQPQILGNQVSSRAVANTVGIRIINTPGATVEGNTTDGFEASGIVTDSASPDAKIIDNSITGNTADQYGMNIAGNNTLIQNNNFYGLTTTGGGEIALKVSGTGSVVQLNNFDNTAIEFEVFANNLISGTVEMNNINHPSGTGFAVVEDAGSSNNIYRFNIINGGTSAGINLAGTGSIKYLNTFGGTTSPMDSPGYNIAGNIVVPASATGFQGTGPNVSMANGSFTLNHLRKTDGTGSDSDSGLLYTGIPQRVIDCSTTAACTNSLPVNATFTIGGPIAMAGGTITITGITPAYTSNITYRCYAWDVSNSGNTATCSKISGSSITITGTGTDQVTYMLIGN